jgi:hypothetical protein
MGSTPSQNKTNLWMKWEQYVARVEKLKIRIQF